MNDSDGRPVIHSIIFGERDLEVSWHDPQNDRGQRTTQIHTDAVDPGLVPQEIDDIREAVEEIIVKASLDRRQPPPSFVDSQPKEES